MQKLYRFLVSEVEAPTEELLEPLATQFAKGYDFGKLVETVLRSNLFFSEHAYRTRLKAPIDYVLGLARALEAKMGTLNNSVNLTTTLETLGQNVFHPPSVKGWDGGPTWLNGQTLLFRQNFALEMARRPSAYQQPATALTLAKTHNKLKDAELVKFLVDLFLQGDVPTETSKRLTKYAEESHQQKVPSFWSKEDIEENRLIGICHTVLTLPEYQLD